MSDWTIGKEAREAIRKAVGRNRGGLPSTVLEILDRCTDAPEVGGAEPVAWRAEVDGQWFVSKTESALRCALSDAGVTRDIEPLYTRPPEVGLPEGWVAVPVEPTREMWAASGDAILKLDQSGISHHDCISGAVHRAMLSAAPPCPGVVKLPDVNWPFVEEALREYADALTDGGLDGAGRSLPSDIVEYADEIARWLESAGQKESKITARTIATEQGVASEVEYVNEHGVVVGFWAYGEFDPRYPYQGEDWQKESGE